MSNWAGNFYLYINWLYEMCYDKISVFFTLVPTVKRTRVENHGMSIGHVD